MPLQLQLRWEWIELSVGLGFSIFIKNDSHSKGDGPRKSLAISLHEIVGLGAWPI